ncbi:conserved hypothetical protein, partial [Trichinella spiralis]
GKAIMFGVSEKETMEQLKNSVFTNHIWRERKETTRVNFRRNSKRPPPP